ncbi:hypothetical protein AB0J38_10965 [Streptomyces sp. NPDC050095]|uniref:hypothetical protein n=1 Tax=unclassified Streptomyces TaxID=2593676 RepID=UPI0034256B9C
MDRRSLLKGVAAGAVAAPAAGLWTAQSAGAAAVNYPVAICDQHTNRYLVHDRTANWDTASPKWVFDPGNGRTPWDNPFEIRFRATQRYGTLALMTAGNPGSGAAGIVRVTGNGSRLGHGDLLWKDESIRTFPHSIERIPGNGSVVVACTHGAGADTGEIRVYAPSSSDVRTLKLVQRIYKTADLGKLVQPHGVLWDDQLNLLWVIGGTALRTYQVTGSGRGTRLKKVGKEVDLKRGPDGRVWAGKHFGHDVQPDYSRPGSLVITDSNGVYRVDRNTRQKDNVHTASNRYALVKSFVVHPSGQEMWTRDTNGDALPWGAPTVFFSSGGDRTKKRTQIYKARIVTTRFH